jgi:ribosomal protein S18 acetylase RimI-like enzyme
MAHHNVTVPIRAAHRDDYDAYARLFPHLGVDDPLPSRDRFAADLVPRMLIATDGDEIVGYALYELLAGTGYVRNLVTAPAARRRGVGAALMDALRLHFRGHGAADWCLNVKVDNTAAIGLYRRCGLAPRYRSASLRLPSEAALPAPPPELAIAPIDPDEDAALEPGFGLLAGQLASARAKLGRQLLALRRGDDVLGVAVFMAEIPGAFPFRVAAPALGLAFAAHLRGLVPAGAPWLQLGIEDDAALRAALVAAGARLQFEIVHMRGALA